RALVLEKMGTDTKQALFSSMSEEWYTPAEYIEAARQVLTEFDLDPASNPQANEVVKASLYYDKKTNGLENPWHGRVWCNPPYGGDEGTGAWVEKMIAEYLAGRMKEGVLLVNAVTDRKWFQPLFDYPICFTNHRIKFNTPYDTPESPVSGNVFVYFG